MTNDQLCRCGRPTAGAQLCDDCQTTLRWSLANVSAYADDLGTIARKQSRYGSAGATKGSIGKVQPLPVDPRFAGASEAGSRLQADVRSTLVAWCRIVTQDQPELAGPACRDCLHLSCSAVRRRRWPADTVASMALYLARQFRLVVGAEWAPEIFNELLALERRLARMIDRPADRWYAGKCTSTDETGNTCTAELYATEESGTITCRTCGTRHDVGDRRDFLLAEAREYLVTATQAAGALIAWTDYDGSETKLVDRIRKWRDRDHLEVQDVTDLLGRDRHLYRLGDIQDLLVEHAQGQQTRRLGA